MWRPAVPPLAAIEPRQTLESRAALPLPFGKSSPMPTLRPIIAALSLLLLTLCCARAATLNVPTSQYPTIQAGINAAAPGDIVLVGDGTYTGPGNVDLDFGGKNITVQSVNGAVKTIIDCQGSSSTPHRGFYFHNGETSAAIRGFTVKNGDPEFDPNNDRGGAISIINASHPTIANCTISDNQNNGVYVSGSSNPTFTNCTFDANLINGITSYSGSHLTITNCAFTNTQGAGVEVFQSNSTVTNCTFTGNQIGMDIVGGASTVTGCTFANNYNGTALNVNGSPTITNCTFIGNGGSGMSVNGSPAITNCTFIGNGGGGMYVGSLVGNPTVTNCTFAANQGYEMEIYECSPTVINCAFAGSQGYGIELENNNSSNNPAFTNCILYGDTAGEIALYGSNAYITLSHCDVQGGYAGAGNINADPLFVRNPKANATPPDYGDLHLRPGSPCLGAGTASGAPPTDLDGNLRPNPPSIGAYEVANMPIPGRFDFNRDGSPDLLWQNTRTGQVLFWLMGGADGQQVLSYGSPFATVADTHWHVVSLADSNGDGHPDMLWQNSATNQLVVWSLSGTQVVTYGAPFATVSDTHWQVAGVADFDGDGHPDLLWENSATGQVLVLVWNLGGADGTSVLSYGSAFATVPNTAWRIVGTGDMNGDGHADLVWENSQTGQVLRWLLGGVGGTTVQDYGSPFATVPDTHWQITGVH